MDNCQSDNVFKFEKGDVVKFQYDVKECKLVVRMGKYIKEMKV